MRIECKLMARYNLENDKFSKVENKRNMDSFTCKLKIKGLLVMLLLDYIGL